MSSIKDYEDRVKALKLELAVAEATLHSARMVVAGVMVGDIVQGTKRYAGKHYLVTRVNTTFKPAWVSGNLEKKDGSFGTAVRNIYSDWTKK